MTVAPLTVDPLTIPPLTVDPLTIPLGRGWNEATLLFVSRSTVSAPASEEKVGASEEKEKEEEVGESWEVEAEVFGEFNGDNTSRPRNYLFKKNYMYIYRTLLY